MSYGCGRRARHQRAGVEANRLKTARRPRQWGRPFAPESTGEDIARTPGWALNHQCPSRSFEKQPLKPCGGRIGRQSACVDNAAPLPFMRNVARRSKSRQIIASAGVVFNRSDNCRVGHNRWYPSMPAPTTRSPLFRLADIACSVVGHDHRCRRIGLSGSENEGLQRMRLDGQLEMPGHASNHSRSFYGDHTCARAVPGH